MLVLAQGDDSRAVGSKRRVKIGFQARGVYPFFLMSLRFLMQWLAVGLAGVVGAVAGPESVEVSPDRSSGVYRVGDEVRWTVTWTDETRPAPASVDYVFKRGGATEVASGTVDFAAGVARLESKFAAPNTMLLEVSWREGEETFKDQGGAVAAPEQIGLAVEAPADFDAWWAEKIAELAAVPMHPRLAVKETAVPGVAYGLITMDNIRGSEIHGQWAKPSGGGGVTGVVAGAVGGRVWAQSGLGDGARGGGLVDAQYIAA